MTESDSFSSAAPMADAAVPLGFAFAATRAGIKPSGNPDFAWAVARQPAAAAAMFTSNRVAAAPILVGRRHLERSRGAVRAVVVNAGNANCATGEPGLHAAQRVCAEAARILGCEAHDVLPSSTGIIGVSLAYEKLLAALPSLHSGLGATGEHFDRMAEAIMTTDTRRKTAAATLESPRGPVRIAGMVKGAGMIFPQLAPAAAPHATMLGYLFTDAAISPATASRLLERACTASFNRISIDGDTSTNDTLMLLASGASGVAIEADPAPAEQPLTEAFASALQRVCLSLAKQMVGDGEGVGHVVELDIRGAASDAEALRVARSIAHSPLVKTAWAGCDPNWGRLLAAAGYSGARIDPGLISIRIGEQEICSKGMVSPRLDAEAARRVMLRGEYTVHIDLGLGEGRAQFWTCDLTEEYVRINAAYST